MIEDKVKNAFWDVVIECLVQFHHWQLGKAREATIALSKGIEKPPLGLSSDIFYHSEPFDVACDLAKVPLSFSEYRDEYNKILDSNNL